MSDALIQLSFPPIHKLLIKDSADLPGDSPMKGIIIYGGNAIVITSQMMTVVNLREYFVVRQKKTTMDDQNSIDAILDFMNGGMFSSMFWQEITQNAIISIVGKKVHLEGGVRKDVYTDRMLVNLDMVKRMAGEASRPCVAMDQIAFKLSSLDQLFKAFSFVKKDSLILGPTSTNGVIKFTFADASYISGVIAGDADASGTIFPWNDLTVFDMDLNPKDE